ncbi:MAG: transglycosylase SLT domain-containing protein [Spirochaetaceae bacterium]|nr:transglycosylase SLT domain-containing protein [Spirochaetaceae bacterium]
MPEADINNSDVIPLIEDNAKLNQDVIPSEIVDVSFGSVDIVEDEYLAEELFDDVSYKNAVVQNSVKLDKGLQFYRSIDSRSTVEWFYTNITDSRDIACAILQAADKNDIPVSLAFALAYTESRYKIRAVNRNTNSSVDRGLFQLNNRSFPNLTEQDFFDPQISAKYGMSHLRHCLDTAGNEIAALAMYNAGTNRVRNNATPQMTLNYVSNIISYRQGLDDLFESEVVQLYSNSFPYGLTTK